MVSLAALLKYNGATPLGGIISLSGLQALQFDEKGLSLDDLYIKNQTPIFLYHGTSDKMIPIKNAKLSYGFLKENLGNRLTTKIEKRHDHSISSEETRHLREWFVSIMVKKDKRIETAKRFWVDQFKPFENEGFTYDMI